MAKKKTTKAEEEEKNTSAAKKIAKKKTTKSGTKKTAAKKTTAKKSASKSTSKSAGKSTAKKSTAKKSTSKTSAKKSTAKSKAAESKSKEPDIRYPDEDLEMFKKVIDESRREAMDELRMLKERLEDLTNYDFAEESMIYSMHMAEQGSEAMEKEKTYAQIQRIHEYIKKLDDALGRIKDKTYGICRVCGCLIAKERLMAVPITTLSASYKIHQKCPDDGIDRIEPLKK